MTGGEQVHVGYQADACAHINYLDYDAPVLIPERRFSWPEFVAAILLVGDDTRHYAHHPGSS
jgi:hypothetical protein